MKDSVTLHPGQGAWVYLTKDSEKAIGDSFIFPVLFNTVTEKNLSASKFSPRAGMLCSPAIYMINHNNDIFVQVKRGESLGKLIDLRMESAGRQPVIEEGGAVE